MLLKVVCLTGSDGKGKTIQESGPMDPHATVILCLLLGVGGGGWGAGTIDCKNYVMDRNMRNAPFFPDTMEHCQLTSLLLCF